MCGGVFGCLPLALHLEQRLPTTVPMSLLEISLSDPNEVVQYLFLPFCKFELVWYFFTTRSTLFQVCIELVLRATLDELVRITFEA